MDTLARNLRPSQLVTKQALENAVASVTATGGSTNAILHLLAIAHEEDVDFTLNDIDRINANTPLLADLKLGGRFTAPDMFEAGGVPLLAKRMLEANLLHDILCVNGKTISEQVHDSTEQTGQQVLTTTEKPLKPQGGLAVLWGNLAPEGAALW